MPNIENIIQAAASIQPLTLAVLFIGLISLGLIWLAAVAIKINGGRKK